MSTTLVNTLNLIITDHRLSDVCLGDAMYEFPHELPLKPTCQRFSHCPGSYTRHVIIPKLAITRVKETNAVMKYIAMHVQNFFDKFVKVAQNTTRSIHIFAGGEDLRRPVDGPMGKTLLTAMIFFADRLKQMTTRPIQIWWLGIGDPHANDPSTLLGAMVKEWRRNGLVTNSIYFEDVTSEMRSNDLWHSTYKFTPDFLMRTARRVLVHLTTYQLQTFRINCQKRSAYPFTMLNRPETSVATQTEPTPLHPLLKVPSLVEAPPTNLKPAGGELNVNQSLTPRKNTRSPSTVEHSSSVMASYGNTTGPGPMRNTQFPRKIQATSSFSNPPEEPIDMTIALGNVPALIPLSHGSQEFNDPELCVLADILRTVAERASDPEFLPDLSPEFLKNLDPLQDLPEENPLSVPTSALVPSNLSSTEPPFVNSMRSEPLCKRHPKKYRYISSIE